MHVAIAGRFGAIRTLRIKARGGRLNPLAVCVRIITKLWRTYRHGTRCQPCVAPPAATRDKI